MGDARVEIDMSETLALLGIDPGFSAIGLARLELRPDGSEVVDDLAVIVTEPSAKRRKVLATEDNVRRLQEIGAALAPWIASDVVAICAESQSWPRNAGSSAKVGMSWGTIAELARVARVPILQASPQQVKRALTGRKDASKDEVRAALEARYQVRPEWPRQKGLVEHAADALACAVVCTGAPEVLAARRARWVT